MVTTSLLDQSVKFLFIVLAITNIFSGIFNKLILLEQACGNRNISLKCNIYNQVDIIYNFKLM